MWEISLKTSSNHFFVLEYIEKQLCNRFLHKVVVGKLYSKICCLSIATREENKNEVWEYLKRLLCDVFCEKFKVEFLENHITFMPKDNPYFSVFLKVFTYFDLELERSVAYRLIEYHPVLFLESYFWFKMQVLRSKWQDLCNITNQNEQSLLTNETFLNFLKFLISNLHLKTESVVLSFKDGCLLYQESTGEQVFVSLSNNPVDTICKIIDLSPNTILVYSNPKFKETEEIIKFLFDERIKNL